MHPSAEPVREPIVHTVHPVLGTVLEVRTTTDRPDAAAVAAAAEHAALATIDRLEDVFSIYRPTSELSRWRAGDDAAAGPELVEVLALVARWFEAGRGTFNPCVGHLAERWRDAAAAGVAPTSAELAIAAHAIGSLPFAVEGSDVRRTGDCSGLELHAIAKGWIVDRATDAGAAGHDVASFVVNLGGDLRHVGEGSLLVGIEDPFAPWDNAPPRTTVEIAGRGLATSGSTRRGVQIGERWYGHVLDPRTGRPVEHLVSTSVVAADAATADVVATIVGVLDIVEALAFADAIGEVAVLLIGADGQVHRNDAWRAIER